jgi:hypothetical protein
MTCMSYGNLATNAMAPICSALAECLGPSCDAVRTCICRSGSVRIAGNLATSTMAPMCNECAGVWAPAMELRTPGYAAVSCHNVVSIWPRFLLNNTAFGELCLPQALA